MPAADDARPWGRFPTTRWTLILAARPDEAARREALHELLSAYWRPVYFFLRRRGLPVEAAEDAVQGFFLHVLERDFLRQVDPARGRFRSYLLTALQNHLANAHEREAAQKRGGGAALIPLDLVLAERDLAAAPEVPEAAFEREWALDVMERAIARLQQEYAEGRRKGHGETVLRFFRLDDPPSHEEAARACGLTLSQWKAHLHRARARFRELLREEVRGTVDEEKDVQEEMASLVRALSA